MTAVATKLREARALIERGPCKAGHPVTLENTVRVGKAGYRCRECRRATGLKHWHSKAKFARFPHLAKGDA
jgi:transposase-like protein